MQCGHGRGMSSEVFNLGRFPKRGCLRRCCRQPTRAPVHRHPCCKQLLSLQADTQTRKAEIQANMQTRTAEIQALMTQQTNERNQVGVH
jgi:hypothetical protein